LVFISYIVHQCTFYCNYHKTTVSLGAKRIGKSAFFARDAGKKEKSSRDVH